MDTQETRTKEIHYTIFPSQFISIDAFSHQKQLSSNKERGKYHKALHSQSKSLIFLEYEFLHHKLSISWLSHENRVKFVHFMHWKHIWHMDLSKDVKFMWHLFIHKFILHMSTHLSMCQICFQCMIFVCKMYELMNERTSHNFHY